MASVVGWEGDLSELVICVVSDYNDSDISMLKVSGTNSIENFRFASFRHHFAFHASKLVSYKSDFYF